MTFVDSEKEREANIAKNRALLAQLDIGLGFPASKSKPQKGIKPVQASQPRKRKAAELPAPRRQSSRLNKPVVNPHETPKERRKREVFTRYRMYRASVVNCLILLDGRRGNACSRAGRTA